MSAAARRRPLALYLSLLDAVPGADEAARVRSRRRRCGASSSDRKKQRLVVRLMEGSLMHADFLAFMGDHGGPARAEAARGFLAELERRDLIIDPTASNLMIKLRDPNESVIHAEVDDGPPNATPTMAACARSTFTRWPGSSQRRRRHRSVGMSARNSTGARWRPSGHSSSTRG